MYGPSLLADALGITPVIWQASRVYSEIMTNIVDLQKGIVDL